MQRGKTLTGSVISSANRKRRAIHSRNITHRYLYERGSLLFLSILKQQKRQLLLQGIEDLPF